MRRCLAALVMLILALPAGARDAPGTGLLWNRSGLPATLPLHVKTPPGRDYAIFLATEPGRPPAMAGYIRGGTLLRLLVPPGTWHVSLAHGRDWQGEDRLFGPDTGWLHLPEPLRFTSATARRQGYIIRLTDRDGQVAVASVAAQDTCQTVDVTTTIVPLDSEQHDPSRLPTPGLRRLEIDAEVRDRLCD